MAGLISYSTSADFTSSKKSLSDLIKRTSDLSEFNQDVGQYLVNAIRNRFYTTKTGPNGVRWSPNSELTRQTKSGSLLVETGELASSVRAVSDAHGVLVGTDSPYAEVTQKGRSHTRGRYRSDEPVPARPFMGINEVNRKRIARMLRAHITANTNFQGLGE